MSLEYKVTNEILSLIRWLKWANFAGMRMVTVPGFHDLFVGHEKNYDEFLKDIPSEIVIAVLIMLNNELNAPLPETENQQRLRNIVTFRFSQDQKNLLDAAYSNYRRKTKGQYQDYVFGRRYLLSMILKELNAFRSFELVDTSPQQEFNLLMAYLLTVEKVNEKDHQLLDQAREKANDPLGVYRMIWTPNFNQYDFNERCDAGFQFFKLLSLVPFALQKYRPYAKEYLNNLGFTRYGQLLHSIHVVTMTTLDYRKNEVFSKLNYINPTEGVDETHLKAQTINSKIGTGELELSDIRKAPLFYNHNYKYMVIDEDLYNRKTYKGPFLNYIILLRCNIKLNLMNTAMRFRPMLLRKFYLEEFSKDFKITNMTAFILMMAAMTPLIVFIE